MTEPIQTALQPSKKAQYLDTVEADSAMRPTTLGGMMRLAEVISTAGLCPKHLKNDAGSTMLVMAAAQQLGLPWFTGLQKAYVIDGKVAFEAVVLIACARRSPRCKALYLEEVTDDKATMVIQTVDMAAPIRVSYTYAEAQKAGLTGKGPWNSYRRNMLVARVSTNVSRWYFAEETLGIFTKEELDEMTAEVVPVETRNVTPPSSITEALDRVAAKPEPEVVATEAPAPRRGRPPGQKPKIQEPAPEPIVFAEVVPEPQPVQGVKDKATMWRDLSTKLLGPSGPQTMMTFVNATIRKPLNDLNEAEEDKLDAFINEVAMANQGDNGGNQLDF